MIKAKNGYYLQHLAAAGGHLEVLEHLSQMGADLEARSNEGITLL